MVANYCIPVYLSIKKRKLFYDNVGQSSLLTQLS
uniref:Uncharacterized protein n=1 Tax=Anguilla anguilla TaxID=7936 RepID=A0A0E9URK4_ANGAN